MVATNARWLLVLHVGLHFLVQWNGKARIEGRTRAAVLG